MGAFLRKYATASTVYFPLISYNSVSFTSTASLTTADMKMSLDGAAFTTVGTAITNVGSYGYSYTFTTADLTGKSILMIVRHTAAAPGFEDTALAIETYGNTGAMHTFDLSIANQTVIASAGTVMLAASALSAGAIVAGAFSAGAFAAGFLSAGGIAASAISAGGIASAAITSAKIATGGLDSTNFGAGFLSNGGIATAAISSAKIATGGLDPTNFAAGFVSAGGIATGAITSVKFAAGAVDSVAIGTAAFEPAKFAAGFISAGGIAANAISAGGIATNAIDADALATDAVTEIWGVAGVPATTVPAWTASMLSILSWQFALTRNTITQTSVLQVVMQSDGITALAQSTLGDDNTTFTKGSFN